MATTRKTPKRRTSPKGVSSLLRNIVDEQRQQRKDFMEHGRDDHRQFTDMRREAMLTAKKTDVEALKHLMLDEHGDLALATKKDVAAVLEAFNNITLAAKIIRGGGTWTWRALFGAAAIIAVIGVIKGGWLAALHYVYSLASGL